MERRRGPVSRYLWTGQTGCYDIRCEAIPCPGTGQDAERRRSAPSPVPRLARNGALVTDRLTGLLWSRDANPAELPLTWDEALEWGAGCPQDGWLGRWHRRLPNRPELFSLAGFRERRPALPRGHRPEGVFPIWYWSANSLRRSPAHAWIVHMAVTRKGTCFDRRRRTLPSGGSAQDGDVQPGIAWPQPRFLAAGEALSDRLTGLGWRRRSDLDGADMGWPAVLRAGGGIGTGWRLPTMRQLESRVDCARTAPAVADGGPLPGAAGASWASTTGGFEPDRGLALFARDGAVGVGQKRAVRFRALRITCPPGG
jgi:hypothetical protein